MNITEEVGDDEFNFLLAEKHHEELLKSLKIIALNISEVDIEGVKEQIKDLIIITQNISKINSKEVYLQIKEICNQITLSNNKVIEALSNRLLPSTFDLIKFNGVTQSVKVNYKPANQITI